MVVRGTQLLMHIKEVSSTNTDELLLAAWLQSFLFCCRYFILLAVGTERPGRLLQAMNRRRQADCM